MSKATAAQGSESNSGRKVQLTRRESHYFQGFQIPKGMGFPAFAVESS
jgi:hypothetical protein